MEEGWGKTIASTACSMQSRGRGRTIHGILRGQLVQQEKQTGPGHAGFGMLLMCNGKPLEGSE